MRASQSILAAAAVVCALSTAAAAEDPHGETRALLTSRCAQCHGGVKRSGGFAFTDPGSLFAPAESGATPVVRGDPSGSELLARVTSPDADERMPPPQHGPPLAARDIAQLRAWIAAGAQWPRPWAFGALRSADPPPVSRADWPLNPIDRYVLARLERAGLTPSPEAGRPTLVRRVALDLTGLPPTLEQVDAFLGDSEPGAYERMVDRFLASPHFGERWARHWLDQARYADSDGYEKDNARPGAWRWRQWVIESINADQPFDEFTREQLAGDLLRDATPQQRLATAFHRQTLFNREGGVDPEEDRTKRVIDRTNTTATTWLGLTTGCAQCHDHPYDPIRQRDFFRLFAYFNNADETSIELPRHRPEDLAALEAELAKARALGGERQQAWLRELGVDPATGGAADRLPAGLAELYAAAAGGAQRAKVLADHYFGQVDPVTRVLSEELEGARKRNRMSVRILQQRARNPRPTYLFYRGDFLQPQPDEGPIEPGVPEVLAPAGELPSRLELADWLVSSDNPLTARVAANVIWSKLFGHGLVATLDDFGARSSPPSHPGLLDWLAGEFVRSGWSRKQLIRTIVTSRTYRQSSAHRPSLQAADPGNRLLHRQNRLRVEAEIVRDLHLAVSGLLDPAIGGESVFPPIPADVAAQSYASSFKWQTSEGADRYRRGMYTFFKRTVPDPNLMVFDCPDSNVTAVRRSRSNTPLMALATLHNEVYHEAAQAFAARILDDPEPDSDHGRLAKAFRICVARSPGAGELAPLEQLLRAGRSFYASDPAAAAALVGRHQPQSSTTAEAAAWVATLRVLTNLDEFITRN